MAHNLNKLLKEKIRLANLANHRVCIGYGLCMNLGIPNKNKLAVELKTCEIRTYIITTGENAKDLIVLNLCNAIGTHSL